MRCEKCQNQKATVFLTHIVHGKMQKVDLCESCAKAMGVTNAAGFSLADLLLKPSEEDAAQAEPFGRDHSSCPQCGMTAADFKKGGRLGCGRCYETFSDLLGEVMKDMHKSMQHRGKFPARLARTELMDQRLSDLKRDLQLAVDAEQFEEAAWLRDQIRLLENNV